MTNVQKTKQSPNKDFDKHKNICRFLSFILRHKPQIAHLKLDNNGFAELDKVLAAIEKRFKLRLTVDDLNNVIKKYAHNFFLINDGKIKAKFGHTVILNMLTPDGFETTKNVPQTLYACINRNEMTNVVKIGVQSCVVFDGLVENKMSLDVRNNLIISINTEKAIKNNIEFFFNPISGKYFCKFIPSTFIKIEL